MAPACLAAPPSRYGLKVCRNLRYGPDAAHRLDLWIPAGPGPHPVALYIHGGGFRVLSKETHWMMARELARLGYLTVSINYRLAPVHPYPSGVQDVLLAWQWLHANIAAHGGDPSHTIVAGDSAGANFAATVMLATCWRRPEPWAAAAFDAAPPPAAVVAAYGIFQTSDTRRYWSQPHFSRMFIRRARSVSEDYLGEHHANHRPGWGDLADPVVYLERSPPAPDRPLPAIFLPVGERDPLLPDSQRMHDAAAALGASVTMAIYPGAHHSFNAYWWTASARASWHDCAQFLSTVRRSAYSGSM